MRGARAQALFRDRISNYSTPIYGLEPRAASNPARPRTLCGGEDSALALHMIVRTVVESKF